jgi:hypothetical protein
MNERRGTCIGGPLDGQVRRADGETFDAHNPIRPRPEAVRPAGFGQLDAVDLTISTTTYRYEPWRTANAEWACGSRKA